MWTILKNIELWVPFYVIWVPFWSPFCSELGPLFRIFGSPFDFVTVDDKDNDDEDNEDDKNGEEDEEGENDEEDK